MSERSIAVAIVEDDREIREALTLIIDGSPGYACTQAYNDAEAAVGALPKAPPDVVLMDIDLPGMSGIEAVGRLRKALPDAEFIMLTIHEDDESLFRSVCAGATGYLVKDIPPAELLEAIRDVHGGGSPMSPGIARRVVDSFKPAADSPLTPRETEVLQRLCDGDNYRAIADALFISGDTVRAHIKNIYKKLEVHSRAAAVRIALRDRLI